MSDYDKKYIDDELLKDRKEYKEEVFNKNLGVELKDREDVEKYGYDFVPRLNQWTNLNEQEEQVTKIENITKVEKK